MYREYFGLKEKPFSIAPNAQYFYMSTGHREALAHLLYGIKGEGGFVLLTGEVGTGKTTVSRVLLDLMPKDFEIAFLLNPPSTVVELLATLCDEFGIAYQPNSNSIKDYVTQIYAFLLDLHAKGRRPVLIVEEAQNLSTEVLEQIRLLTNLETNERKLLQIIMIGQPELREKLSRPELRQISQRITARYHLGPLSRKEVSEYVSFRLTTAGLKRGTSLFPARTITKLYRLTQGLPRLINSICDRALLGAYVEGKKVVDTGILMAAAGEVMGETNLESRRLRIYQGAAAAFVLLLCVTVLVTYLQRPHFLTREAPKTVAEGAPLNADPTGVPESIHEEPVGHAASATRESAYRTLFDLWQIRYIDDKDKTACQQAEEQGLRCLESNKGTIEEIREKGRPAVLRLSDKRGDSYFVTLKSLHGETATCVSGSETKTLPLNTIAQNWSGEYLLLWRVPSDYRGKIRPGQRGPLVAWLDRQLALATGRTPRPGLEQLYSQEMTKEVKEFQRSRRLKPDGVAGLGTILKLTAAAGTGEPALDQPNASN